MRLCSGHNYTLLMANLLRQNLLWYVDKGEKWPRGKLADSFLKNLFLDDIETLRHKGKCFFVWADQIGSYFPSNKSYNGAIQLLIESKADTLIRPLNYYSVKHQLVGYSDAASALGHYTVQLMNKNLNNQNERTLMKLISFLMPSFGFMFILFISLLLYFAFSFFISNLRTSYKRKIAKTIKLFLLFYILFWFIMKNLFSANLNTSNVIVDTTDLLHDNEKLLNTKKEFCFFEQTVLNDYIKNSPPSSLVHRVYEKRNKTNVCIFIVDGKFGNLLNKDLTKLFILMPDFNIKFISRIIQTYLGRDTFIKDDQVYEVLTVFIVRKNLEKEILNLFNLWVNSNAMFGFLKKTVDSLEKFTGLDLVETLGKNSFRTYTNLQDYIEDYTFIGPISFCKLEYLFKIYFIFQIAISLIGLIHYFLKKIKVIR